MPEIDAQKALIEDLAHSNNEYIQKFEKLRLAIADSGSVNAPKTYIPLPAPKPRESNHKHSVEDLNLIALTDKHNMKFTHSASTDSSSVFDFLGLKLEHYQRLVDALLEEVHQPQYNIPNDSRLRIRTNILNTHVHEWRMMLIRARSASVNMQEDVTWSSTAMAANNPGTDLPFKDEELPHSHQQCLNWLFITSGSPDTFPYACSRCIDRLYLERIKSDHDDVLMPDHRSRGFLQEPRQQMTCEKVNHRRGKRPKDADWEMAGIAPNLHQDIQQDIDRWDALDSWAISTQPKIQLHNLQPQPQKIATAEITPYASKDSADNNEHKASLNEEYSKYRCRAAPTEDLDQQPDARDEPFRKIESLHHCLMPPKNIDQQPEVRNEPFPNRISFSSPERHLMGPELEARVKHSFPAKSENEFSAHHKDEFNKPELLENHTAKTTFHSRISCDGNAMTQHVGNPSSNVVNPQHSQSTIDSNEILLYSQDCYLFCSEETQVPDLASGYHPRSIETKPNKRNHEDDCELGWEAMTEIAGPIMSFDCHQVR